METALIIGIAVLVVVFLYMATPNTYQPRPPSEFVNRLKPINNMHTALMVQSALNIKNKCTMDNENKCTGTDKEYAACEKVKVPVSVVRDDNAHWYVIPKHLHEEFRTLLEKSTDTKLSDDEMYNAQDKFIETFSQYMTGGDINNTQLYAEI